MKLAELFEGLSPILYHFTQIGSALSILESNTIRLSPQYTKGSESEHGDSLFYLSTSRTRTGKYHASNSSGVLFQLDGRKLHQRFSGNAVDYWGASFRDIDPQTEQEDRLYADVPEIRNFMSYVQGIDVVLSSAYQKPRYDTIETIKKIYFLSKRHSVPIRLFSNSRDFVARQNPVPVTDFVQQDRETKYNMTHDDRVWKHRSESKKIGKRDTSWGVYYGLMFSTNDRLPNHARESIEYFMYMWQGMDRSTVNTDFHNLSHSRYKNARKLIDDIASLMRRNRLTNINQAAEYIYSKWKDILTPSYMRS